ncbi:hypothetical protein ACFWUZ_34170 [Streptomyces sp. NPDC058646]|uniref:hypothetical protein n=1 Tax=Streptomyces sp. NPDC058646 TaxID=3346574 RepID=UPI003664910E
MSRDTNDSVPADPEDPQGPEGEQPEEGFGADHSQRWKNVAAGGIQLVLSGFADDVADWLIWAGQQVFDYVGGLL